MPPEQLETLVAFFKALADPSRLQILGLCVHQERTVEELATILGVGPPTVSHHLKRLKAIGLVSVRPDGNVRFYRLDTDALHRLSKDVLKPGTLAEAATELPLDRFEKKVLKTFIVEGKLVSIPAQRKKRDVILRFLTYEFDSGREYPEAEVNEILTRFHPDCATLRRELVGAGLMARERAVYRRLMP